ncbi:hypothetical protein MKW94_013436 [Papaver nudicaule]|uniref:Defensin n=1 Tax=Papaver nudicaule TaxID=74823 RepID=A0AA41VVT4_PAPNU|nr:hypothetical protein [Papaver nudicaule]
MKFTVLLSLFLMCLVLSNNASAYWCDKNMTGTPFRGPCQPHCQYFCNLYYYQGTGTCLDQHICSCYYHSYTPCQ